MWNLVEVQRVLISVPDWLVIEVLMEVVEAVASSTEVVLETAEALANFDFKSSASFAIEAAGKTLAVVQLEAAVRVV